MSYVQTSQWRNIVTGPQCHSGTSSQFRINLTTTAETLLLISSVRQLILNHLCRRNDRQVWCAGRQRKPLLRAGRQRKQLLRADYVRLCAGRQRKQLLRAGYVLAMCWPAADTPVTCWPAAETDVMCWLCAARKWKQLGRSAMSRVRCPRGRPQYGWRLAPESQSGRWQIERRRKVTQPESTSAPKKYPYSGCGKKMSRRRRDRRQGEGCWRDWAAPLGDRAHWPARRLGGTLRWV